MAGNRLRWLVVLLWLLGGPLQAQDDEPQSETAAKSDVIVKKTIVAPKSMSEHVDRLIGGIHSFEKNSGDADSLFHELDNVLRTRIQLINGQMRDAGSPSDAVTGSVPLPSGVETIADLHVNIAELYAARLRLVPYLSDELQLEVAATDVIGVEQLTLERDYIWEQVRFRTLNFPASFDNLVRRIQIAPLPILWRFIQFVLVILIFRWWRKWLPETLRRMQVSLAEIRPRTPAVVRRIRLLWYVEQLRRPIEWLLVTTVLLSMIHMEGLTLLIDIIETVVRWILLGWLAVATLDAFSARGAAGLTGEEAAVRLKSLRLIAAWLVLLGLGLDLAENLTGVATLHAWVWRLFQVLALPVLIVLLAWWRKPIFTRLERESENSESVQSLLRHQQGFRSFGTAAKGALWLLANGMRRFLMRSFLRVGDVQSLGLTSNSSTDESDTSAEDLPGISDEQREKLVSGASGFDKYARSDRRRLVRQARAGQPGITAVVGERGIGKSRFLDDTCAALDGSGITLECKLGLFREIQESLCEQLSVDKCSVKNVSAALLDKGIHTIFVKNIHRLSRPVAEGQAELRHFTEFMESIKQDILWVMSVDCFAWQFLRRVRADQASIHEVIELPSWSEDQLTELLDQRNAEAGIEPDFSGVQVPPEHAVTDYDTAELRNKAGVYRMLWTVAGGNPAVALMVWSNCLYFDAEAGEQVQVRLPVQPSSRDLDNASHNVLLVLRCIAQADLITETDIVDNLRLPTGAVGSAMHYCASRGWIEEIDGQFRITMRWFKTITRVLARQNLLAR